MLCTINFTLFQQYFRHLIIGMLFESLMMQRIGLKGMKYCSKKTIPNVHCLQRLIIHDADVHLINISLVAVYFSAVMR